MKKLTVILTIAAVLMVVAASRLSLPPKFVEKPQPPDESDDKVPAGPVAYVVVDFDGVYLDTQKIEFKYAGDVISQFVKTRQIRNIGVYGTESAHYGEVASLYARLKSQPLQSCVLMDQVMLTGTRMPGTGYLKVFAGYMPIDVENNMPNKAPVPTTPAVTPAADAPVAPAGVAAHL